MDLDARLAAIEARLDKLEGRKPVQPGEFERFWAAYPNKVGKRAAQKAFQNAKNRPSIDVILAALERACKSEKWRKDGGEFIPNPATWLNQGRWDDEPVQIVHIIPKAMRPIECQPKEQQPYSPPPPEVLALLNRIGKGM
jgi:hypothetical protein